MERQQELQSHYFAMTLQQRRLQSDAIDLLILRCQMWGGHFKFIDHVTSSVLYKDSTTKKTTISSYPSRPGWLLMLLACWSYVWRPFSWSYEIMCGTCVRHPWTTRAAHKIGLMISSRTRQKWSKNWTKMVQIFPIWKVILKLRDNVCNVCSSPVDHTANSQN